MERQGYGELHLLQFLLLSRLAHQLHPKPLPRRLMSRLNQRCQGPQSGDIKRQERKPTSRERHTPAKYAANLCRPPDIHSSGDKGTAPLPLDKFQEKSGWHKREKLQHPKRNSNHAHCHFIQQSSLFNSYNYVSNSHPVTQLIQKLCNQLTMNTLLLTY